MARGAGRAAEFYPVRPQPGGDRLAPSRARFDPLIHPVEITGHCVIGDEIRIPVAWCDVAGCEAAFADPAALGEADNRARAVFAGWGKDALGRLVCPACRQHHQAAPVWWVFSREPGAGPRLTAASPPPPVSQLPPAPGHGRHQRGMQRPRLFGALASGRNGQAAPGRIAGP